MLRRAPRAVRSGWVLLGLCGFVLAQCSQNSPPADSVITGAASPCIGAITPAGSHGLSVTVYLTKEHGLSLIRPCGELTPIDSLCPRVTTSSPHGKATDPSRSPWRHARGRPSTPTFRATACSTDWLTECAGLSSALRHPGAGSISIESKLTHGNSMGCVPIVPCVITRTTSPKRAGRTRSFVVSSSSTVHHRQAAWSSRSRGSQPAVDGSNRSVRTRRTCRRRRDPAHEKTTRRGSWRRARPALPDG